MNYALSIDLIICTYNNAILLEQTLTAISQQKLSPYVSWKVLVVNNNCTDETVEVVKRMMNLNAFPLEMVTETRQGLTPARLCGVKNTSGNWIAFIDDDCLLNEDWVENAARFALTHPNCGAFGGKVILNWETPPPKFLLDYGWCFAEQEYGDLPLKKPSLVGAGLVVNREALIDVGWVDKQLLQDRVGKKLISGGDVEISFRLASNYDLWYNPTCELKHIIVNKRTSNKYLRKISYGLGICQILSDSLTSNKTWLSWLLELINRNLNYTKQLFIKLIKAWIKQRTTAGLIIIEWNFMKGQWVGILRLLSMESEVRNEIVGFIHKAKCKSLA